MTTPSRDPIEDVPPSFIRQADGRIQVTGCEPRRTYKASGEVLLMFVEAHNDAVAEIERLRARVEFLTNGLCDVAGLPGEDIEVVLRMMGLSGFDVTNVTPPNT